MKIKNFYDNYFLVLILTVTALIMLTIRIIYSKTPIYQTSTKTPEVPAISSDNTRPFVDNNYEDDYPLWKSLPYSSELFTAEKYSNKQTLKVKLLKGNREAAEEELIKWMENNGINPSSHKIIWE
jgi:hypothetical protein